MLKPLTYQIYTDQGPLTVCGFAVDAKCPVRICVRNTIGAAGILWIADHYDTGYRIGKGWHRSAEDAVHAAVSLIERSIASGRYDERIAAIQGKQS
jgi:hypothetical protein